MAKQLPGTEQLSFSFGARSIGRPPELSTIRVPALSTSRRQLDVGEKVLFQIVDEDGDVILSAYAECTTVSFRKHRPANGARRAWYERIHGLELDSEQPEAP